MKRFLKWSGIVAFAALIPMLMAPTGGIPTILSLAKLTVSSPTGKVCSSGVNTGVACSSNNSSTGHIAWAHVVEARGTANNQLGLIVASTAAGNNTDTLFRVQANGTSVFNIDGVGAVSSQGFVIPKMSYGAITPGNGTCSITVAATVQNQNLTSCSCGATGGCTVNFTTSYTTNPPACSVTGAPVTNSVTTVEVTSALIGSVSLQTLNGATNTTQNGGINVICVGT